MPGKSPFAGRRWLSITLRSLHLVGVVLTAMAIFGNSPHQQAAFISTFVTGLGLSASSCGAVASTGRNWRARSSCSNCCWFSP